MIKIIPFFKKLLFAGIIVISFQQALAQKQDLKKYALKLIEENAAQLSISNEDRQNMQILNVYENKSAGTIMVYMQQTFRDIGVYNGIQVMAFKQDKLLSFSGNRIPKIAIKADNASDKPVINASRAVSLAASHLKLPAVNSLTAEKQGPDTKSNEFNLPGIASAPVKASMLWALTKENKVRLCWQVQIAPIKSSDHWLVRVDAQNGTILGKDNLTVSCSWNKPHQHALDCYKEVHYEASDAEGTEQFFDLKDVLSATYRVSAFPYESPAQTGGAPSLQVDPWTMAPANSPATTLKWHNDGTNSYNYTRGNNVYAQEDRDANDATIGKPATSTTPEPALTFNFIPDFSSQPTKTVNQNLAITNLFYWNNIMHDISYLYGFDEVSGNFQKDNLGRGGLGDDYVIADAQDSADFNNANFSTPPDGSMPRMQMYLFNAAPDKICKINAPSNLAGYIPAVESVFSKNNKLANLGPVTGDVVLVNDTIGTHEGCNTSINNKALKGKIALIDRGTCSFTLKVKNAQDAGAIAVLVANNVPDTLITMGGDDSTITIPAVGISQQSGAAIKAALGQNRTVNITLNAIYLDGDLDNGIISHEYTHGISNRLTGGPATTSCLQNEEQMGEGWSDYFALMVTTNWAKAKITDGSNKRAIGSYVMGENPDLGSGIRNFPYSTDLSIDPWTYDDMAITQGEVHNIGEIWASAIWDMTWNIIQVEGINPVLYNAEAKGGNSIALKLVMEGMRLQPCSPGFIDGRDAILRADSILYGGKYSCLIWKAFARRGMGAKASQGSSDSYTDQVTDYTVPNMAIVKKSADKDSSIEGDEINYTLTVTCQCEAITGYSLVDTLSNNVNYLNSDGSYKASDKTVTFGPVNLSPSQSKSFSLKVMINDSTYAKPQIHINEQVTGSTLPNTWKSSSNYKPWTVVKTRSHSAPYSFFIPDPDTISNAILSTAASYALSGISTLSFWHYYDTEANYDGGVVEITTDSIWYDLGQYMIKNGYNSTIDASNQTSISGKKAFTGNSNNQFINTVIDLSAFAGKKVKIRFLFASDRYSGAEGWYIDDIVLKSESGVHNIASLFNQSNKPVSFDHANTIITGGALPIILGEFTAVKKSGTALLQWKTLQEENTSKFIIQRSADGVHYNVIGSVAATGNSSTPVQYQFTDNAPLNGTNFYRLQRVDKDGQFGYSETRLLNFTDASITITISPNPAKDKIRVSIPGNTKELQLVLLNAQGQQLALFNMNNENKQFNLPLLATGIYYLKVSGEAVETTHKLVIKR